MLLQKLKDNANSVSFINFNAVNDDLIINTLLVNKILEVTDKGLYVLSDEFMRLNSIAPTALNYKRDNVSYNTIITKVDINQMK